MGQERWQARGMKWVPVYLVSDQFWCELQVEHELNRVVPAEAKELQVGKEIHRQRELELFKILKVPARTNADQLYLYLYSMLFRLDYLKRTRKTRELSVFGMVDGIPLRGKIDEVQLLPSSGLHIIEIKTRNQHHRSVQVEVACHVRSY